ncbi:hypothetical protein O6H91_12G089900 [Diphasiastrum complanatum]|uniref:Uncharacterized protein n=1 Tax=Diphasiastrum complanatum TaxID=34168 RepID=A0ACC2C4T2_DIPCM|nr:hypothetical protein O6H91_12G089900 [Diphasiastrum complanatum]
MERNPRTLSAYGTLRTTNNVHSPGTFTQAGAQACAWLDQPPSTPPLKQAQAREPPTGSDTILQNLAHWPRARMRAARWDPTPNSLATRLFLTPNRVLEK